jgi:hypothetical protein
MLVSAALIAGLLIATCLPPEVGASAPLRLLDADQLETPLFAFDSPVGPLAYTAGRGLRVGDTGVTLGGYASTSLVRNEGDTARVALDDVSLFVIFDPTPRLHFLAELGYADVVTLRDNGRVASQDAGLAAERLFADVQTSDALNVRAGVFLTPVGRWNAMHAAPLVWTTSRPLTTEAFAPNLTGIMLFGTVFPSAGALTYVLFDQFAPPLAADPEFEPADHSMGGRLELTVDPWSVGASYLAARRDDWRHLGGVDLLWNNRVVELMGEMVVVGGGGAGSEWGAYLQAVIAVTERWSLVQRYEHFAAAEPAPSVDLMSLGLAFRPLPAAVFKVEYLIAGRSTPNAEPGFKASIATLF